MTYIFEDVEMSDYGAIRAKMKEILAMKRSTARRLRAEAFANGYRAADPNADGNMGQAAGYLGADFAKACALFNVDHPVFGQTDPREAGQILLDMDEAE